MAKAIRSQDQNGNLVGYLVRCPACEADDVGSVHEFRVRMNDGSPGWNFNGDFERPTFSPSMFATCVTCVTGPGRKEHCCHSFVRDGRIEYLSDCTHGLAGKIVDLPDFDEKH